MQTRLLADSLIKFERHVDFVVGEVAAAPLAADREAVMGETGFVYNWPQIEGLRFFAASGVSDPAISQRRLTLPSEKRWLHATELGFLDRG